MTIRRTIVLSIGTDSKGSSNLISRSYIAFSAKVAEVALILDKVIRAIVTGGLPVDDFSFIKIDLIEGGSC